jgi:glycosyltransferase involved in cell wall biosynthesis
VGLAGLLPPQSNMRKYAFIATNEWANWGGSELLWCQTAEKLARRGMEVCASVPDFAKAFPLVKHLRSAGVRVVYRKAPSLLYRLGRRIFPLPEYPRRHLRAIGKGVDLVVISQGSNVDGLGWMEEVRDAGYKYAVIAQDAAASFWPNDEIAERLAASYEGASCAYFVSQANLDLSRREFATPLCNAKIVRNPFNVRYDARPAWPGDPSEGLHLACIGRLDVGAKGQDLLVEMLVLPRWRERKVRVSLVGKGINERMLRRCAEQLRLTSVDFLGYRSDIEEVWSKHHALVLPSRHEGMPLAVVEAMLCGRPCIVTDVGGSRELVRDGVNGFLAKAPTVELLDEAMNRAWDARHRLREMGDTAAAHVRQLVSKDPSEDFVRELLAIVDTPTGHKKP